MGGTGRFHRTGVQGEKESITQRRDQGPLGTGTSSVTSGRKGGPRARVGNHVKVAARRADGQSRWMSVETRSECGRSWVVLYARKGRKDP